SEQGPRAAHRLMREHQLGALFVVNRANALVGVVQEGEVATAVQRGDDDLDAIIDRTPITVEAGTVVAGLFAASAQSAATLPDLDDGGRLVGVIPRVTLLSALGQGSDRGDSGAASAGAEKAGVVSWPRCPASPSASGSPTSST